MSDPLTLAVVGTAVLTEGVKFLFEQAREVLQRWRTKRDKASGIAAKVELPRSDSSALDGALEAAEASDKALETNAAALAKLRAALLEYVEGDRAVDPADAELTETVAALRAMLEELYGQRITLRGERRPPTGVRIDATAQAEAVAGYLAAVRVRGLLDGADITARVKADRVEAGGQAVSVDIDLGDGARS